MVTYLAALIERTEVKPSDIGIEELVKEFGLTFGPCPVVKVEMRSLAESQELTKSSSTPWVTL
jgi:hypothetical protein